MSKRPISELSTNDGPPSFNSLPLDVIFDYLKPLDLLACMYTNKASRGTAGQLLNHYEYDADTLSQQTMFAQWLKRPSFGSIGEILPASSHDSPGLAGPLRLKAIEQRSIKLEQNFVILNYKCSYEVEHCVVAVFDDQGALVAIYKFRCWKFYEEYGGLARSSATSENGNLERFIGTMECSGQLETYAASQLDAAWDISDVTLEYEGQGATSVFLTLPNYRLFRLFHGDLSPIEVFTILMHGLSSDTRAIYSLVTDAFSRFNDQWEDYNLERWLGQLYHEDEVDFEDDL